MCGLNLLLFWVKTLPTTEKIRSDEAEVAKAIRYIMALLDAILDIWHLKKFIVFQSNRV